MQLPSPSPRLFLGMRRRLVRGKRRPTAIHRHSADGIARIPAVAVELQLLYIPAVDSPPEFTHRPPHPRCCSTSKSHLWGRAPHPRGLSPARRSNRQQPAGQHPSTTYLSVPVPPKIRDPLLFRNPPPLRLPTARQLRPCQPPPKSPHHSSRLQPAPIQNPRPLPLPKSAA